MSEVNNNQNGVFGGVQFNNNQDISSYFESNNGAKNTYGSGATAFFGDNGSVTFSNNNNEVNNNTQASIFEPIGQQKAITKQGLWTRVKSFLFQEIDLTAPIKVELTPYQQKIENEINEFLHQEVSFKGIFNIFKSK